MLQHQTVSIIVGPQKGLAPEKKDLPNPSELPTQGWVIFLH